MSVLGAINQIRTGEMKAKDFPYTKEDILKNCSISDIVQIIRDMKNGRYTLPAKAKITVKDVLAAYPRIFSARQIRNFCQQMGIPVPRKCCIEVFPYTFKGLGEFEEIKAKPNTLKKYNLESIKTEKKEEDILDDILFDDDDEVTKSSKSGRGPGRDPDGRGPGRGGPGGGGSGRGDSDKRGPGGGGPGGGGSGRGDSDGSSPGGGGSGRGGSGRGGSGRGGSDKRDSDGSAPRAKVLKVKVRRAKSSGEKGDLKAKPITEETIGLELHEKDHLADENLKKDKENPINKSDTPFETFLFKNDETKLKVDKVKEEKEEVKDDESQEEVSFGDLFKPRKMVMLYYQGLITYKLVDLYQRYANHNTKFLNKTSSKIAKMLGEDLGLHKDLLVIAMERMVNYGIVLAKDAFKIYNKFGIGPNFAFATVGNVDIQDSEGRHFLEDRESTNERTVQVDWSIVDEDLLFDDDDESQSIESRKAKSTNVSEKVSKVEQAIDEKIEKVSKATPQPKPFDEITIEEIIAEYNEGIIDGKRLISLLSPKRILTLIESGELSTRAYEVVPDKFRQISKALKQEKLSLSQIMEMYFEEDTISILEFKALICDKAQKPAIINYITAHTGIQKIKELYQNELIDFSTLELIHEQNFITNQEFDEIRNVYQEMDFVEKWARRIFYIDRYVSDEQIVGNKKRLSSAVDSTEETSSESGVTETSTSTSTASETTSTTTATTESGGSVIGDEAEEEKSDEIQEPAVELEDEKQIVEPVVQSVASEINKEEQELVAEQVEEPVAEELVVEEQSTSHSQVEELDVEEQSASHSQVEEPTVAKELDVEDQSASNIQVEELTTEKLEVEDLSSGGIWGKFDKAFEEKAKETTNQPKEITQEDELKTPIIQGETAKPQESVTSDIWEKFDKKIEAKELKSNKEKVKVNQEMWTDFDAKNLVENSQSTNELLEFSDEEIRKLTALGFSKKAIRTASLIVDINKDGQAGPLNNYKVVIDQEKNIVLIGKLDSNLPVICTNIDQARYMFRENDSQVGKALREQISNESMELGIAEKLVVEAPEERELVAEEPVEEVQAEPQVVAEEGQPKVEAQEEQEVLAEEPVEEVQNEPQVVAEEEDQPIVEAQEEQEVIAEEQPIVEAQEEQEAVVEEPVEVVVEEPVEEAQEQPQVVVEEQPKVEAQEEQELVAEKPVEEVQDELQVVAEEGQPIVEAQEEQEAVVEEPVEVVVEEPVEEAQEQPQVIVEEGRPKVDAEEQPKVEAQEEQEVVAEEPVEEVQEEPQVVAEEQPIVEVQEEQEVVAEEQPKVEAQEEQEVVAEEDSIEESHRESVINKIPTNSTLGGTIVIMPKVSQIMAAMQKISKTKEQETREDDGAKLVYIDPRFLNMIGVSASVKTVDSDNPHILDLEEERNKRNKSSKEKIA